MLNLMKTNKSSADKKSRFNLFCFYNRKNFNAND
jgi:hypothetical protein